VRPGIDSSGVVTAKIEHIKDGGDGAVIKSRLERVEIGADERGDPFVHRPPGGRRGRTKEAQRHPHRLQ
jgi:hypothetical protein